MYSLRKILRRMRTNARFRGLALLLVAGLGCPLTAGAATLDPAQLPRIQAATFEVVEAKPAGDPLTYEKPLPLDLLPYQERNDRYYSIGTAFAIGNHRYVTAGHVLLAGLGSLWGPPQLRDAAGRVHAIDKVLKFSLGKDFVVFTLADDAGDAVLPTNTRPTLNQVVYAVGNALGTGVVIRDGLYTSDTPEEQDGRWKWLRFSAPASPGNSGGPLLDKDGKAIGVVLMRSPNENLNYGLPMSEVLDAPEGRAIIDRHMIYQLDIFQAVQNGRWKDEFALPLGLADFYRTLQASRDASSARQLQALLAKEAADLFPQGEGARRLLVQQTVLGTFPKLTVRDSNGQWQLVHGYAGRLSLAANGYVDTGRVGNTGLVHVRRPDNMDAAVFYRDAKARMDLLAAAGLFQRTVAGEKVKITSLGKPDAEAVHTDRWQRPWLVSTWPLAYLNAKVVAYALPVPDGCVMMMRMVPAARVHDSRLDMDQLANFIDVAYAGTLAQWKEYLQGPAPIPARFRDIHLQADYGHRLVYRSPRVTFSYTPAVQAIEPDSLVTLGFRFFMDHGRPAWDVGDIEIWKNSAADNLEHINLVRYDKPPAGLDADITGHWRSVAGRQAPYNGVARYEDNVMKINRTLAAKAAGGSPAIVYTAFYGIGGTRSQKFMKARLDLLTRDMRVLEH